MDSFNILNGLIILAVVIIAVIVYVVDDILQCVIAMAVLGSFIALEFLLLGAPDVAIAEGAVGAVLTPTIFVITLKKVSSKRSDKK